MATDASPDAPVEWTNPWPDITKPAAGYQIIEGVEHYEVFRTTEKTSIYNHHPHVCHHDGVFFAAWSNHRYGEDSPGQRVLCAVSTDGKRWTKAQEAVPSLWSVKPFARPKELGRVATPVQCAAVNGNAYVIAEAHDNVLCQTPEETLWFDRLGHGNIAREIRPDGSLGPIFWLADYPPEPYPGTPPIPDARDAKYRVTAKLIEAHLAKPENQRAWDFRRHTTQIYLSEGTDLCEPTVYRRADGVLVKLWRESKKVPRLIGHRMYACISDDGGQSWTKPVRTGIPDSASKTLTGVLPDGRVFLIGNQVTGPAGDEQPGHYKRDPLSIALSTDGITFDRIASIRHGAPDGWRCGPRNQVTGRGLGYQYPDAVVVGNAMWVIYSVGKEDIAISRVTLSALP